MAPKTTTPRGMAKMPRSSAYRKRAEKHFRIMIACAITLSALSFLAGVSSVVLMVMG